MKFLGDDSNGTVTESGVTLDLNGRKARYGVAYLRTICCQAGVTIHEPEPDSDVLAVDCSIWYPQGDVRVQIKCTSKWTIAGRSLTFPIEQEWVRKWDENIFPVYFVVVLVPTITVHRWLRHDQDGTFHQAAAFWVKLPQGDIGSSIEVPKTQRLTARTIWAWHQDLLDVGSRLRNGDV